MKSLRWLALLGLGAWCPQHLAALETVNLEAGMAFPSVEEAGAARAVALGGAYVGIAEGSASLPWNPAGLAGLSAPELALHHNSTVVGSFQETAVLGLPLGPGNALGASVNFEDSGSIEGRDASGNQVGDYDARAYGASVGWGVRAPADLALGAAVKLNRQDLGGTGATALAVDLGALWAPWRSLTFGAAYTDLGPNVAGYQLGQGLSLGASTYWMKGTDLQWLLALSGEAHTGADNSIHLGVESLIHHCLALRAGYTFNVPDPAASDGLLGWSFGGGIQLARLDLDYAWVPLGEAGNIQRVSLTYAFGGESAVARRHATDRQDRS
jgi:hypothetical protein